MQALKKRVISLLTHESPFGLGKWNVVPSQHMRGCRWRGAEKLTSPWKWSCLKEPEGEATSEVRLPQMYTSEKSQLQNSFDWIEDYNGYNPVTKERESQSWFSSLFKAGFFTWRWRVSLVPRWPAERQVSLVDPLFGSTDGVARLLSVMESQRDLKNLSSTS